MCKMLRLKFDAPSIMTIEKKHQNHSVHIPGKKENTQQEGYALLKAVLCSPEAVFREQMNFVCTNQQVYQETLKEKNLSSDFSMSILSSVIHYFNCCLSSEEGLQQLH